MRILLTNDDGIMADGLRLLAETALSFGEVWIVAPAEQRSAASHSISLHSPVDVWPYEYPVPNVKAFACSGTPADCVRVGSLAVMEQKPDVVLSGINHGYNSATDLQYSATVGAAFEASFQGFLGIALSYGFTDSHETTTEYLPKLLKELLVKEPEYGVIWNVNFPDVPLSACKGILWDRSVSHGMFYRDEYRLIEETDGGRKRYMVKGNYNEDAEEGTDFRAIVDGYISVGKVHNLG